MSRPRTKQNINTSGHPGVVLNLYIAGTAPNSIMAVANIREICDSYQEDTCRIEIIDVLEQPERAMKAGILVTPTLVKLSPAPVTQVVGNLSDRQKVLLAIGAQEESNESTR